MTAVLTLAALRLANRHRLPTFKNSYGQPAHTEPDGIRPHTWYTLDEHGRPVEVSAP